MAKINKILAYLIIGITFTLTLAAFMQPLIGRDQASKSPKLAVNRKSNITRSERGGQNVSRSLSRDEILMLARAVHGEARGESLEGQIAVAAVILNRSESKGFPQSVNGVIFQPGAFDAVDDGQIWLEPDEKAIKAAQIAASGYDPTDNALYYWNPAKTTNKWIWSRPIVKRIGDHVFAK